MNRQCITCQTILKGRIDKKFCCDYCKSLFHYSKRQEEDKLYKSIDRQLKLNRKILKFFNKAGKATVRATKLLEMNFNPNYFTHYWKNRKGDVYLFVYEYGFLKRIENGNVKYILVTWQEYMSNNQ